MKTNTHRLINTMDDVCLQTCYNLTPQLLHASCPCLNAACIINLESESWLVKRLGTVFPDIKLVSIAL